MLNDERNISVLVWVINTPEMLKKYYKRVSGAQNGHLRRIPINVWLLMSYPPIFDVRGLQNDPILNYGYYITCPHR